MSKKITSRDVAKAAGVSQSLVSLILNNIPGKQIKPETRRYVLETAERLNYRININAKNMKSRKAGAIGLLSEWDANSFVFPPVINGIQAFCAENDTGVVICTGKKGSYGIEDYILYYLQNRIDGLIYVSFVGVAYDGVISNLVKNGIPFVCVIGARDIPGVSCVDVSFTESGYIAARHLMEKGYNKIAYVLSTPTAWLENPETHNYGEKERLEGCRKTVSEAGKSLMLIDSFTDAHNKSTLLEAAMDILKAEDIDAIISTSYNCYIALITAAKLEIQVPESLGVISLDNEIYAPYLYPSLTTVDEPLFDIADRAVRILFEKIQGDLACKKLELPPDLTVRESTCRKIIK